MRWSSMPKAIQREFAKFRGIVSPDAIMEFVDRIDREFAGYVKDAVTELKKTGTTRKPARRRR